MNFGEYVQALRYAKKAKDPSFTVRGVAEKAGMEFGYLSRIERGQLPPPSEEIVVRLAEVLGADPDVLLAMSGRVSKRFQEALQRRPEMFANLIRAVQNAPDSTILRIVREVRDGRW